MQQKYSCVKPMQVPPTSYPFSPSTKPGEQAFTLVEVLLVIAIIGIMSALILTVIGNAAQDSHRVVARQQQVSLQQALNAWINSPANSNSLTVARANYNAAGNQAAILALLQNYLGADTYGHMSDTNYTTGSQVGSESLRKANSHLEFSTWTTSNYPTVNMIK